MVSLSHRPSATTLLTPQLAPQLMQSLCVLQMPILELSAWIEQQLENNPLVELITQDYSSSNSRVIDAKRVVEQRDFYKEKSLSEHLEWQARLFFKEPHDLEKAFSLLAELDEKGFLPQDTPDSQIVQSLQLFDPPGICARSLQECLLLQLHRKGQVHSFASTIIQNHFDDLIHYRIAKIRKRLRCTCKTLYDALYGEIAALSTNPANRYSCSATLFPIPDLFLREEEDGWQIEINRSYLPRIRLSARFRSQIQEAGIQEYLCQKTKEAKQLILSVKKRNSTLLGLGRLLLRTQQAFLEGQSAKPLYLKIGQVAHELKLHPSTIGRTIANKYISCDHFGIVPLSFFFLHAGCTQTQDVGETISSIIAKENEFHPLHDNQIAEQLRKCGIVCARRTVAKYRKLQQIPPASRRKNRLP